MAEQDDNWFGSFLNAAKDKSSKVLEFVKKDLEEFGNAVKTEASCVVQSTGNVLEKTFSLESPDSTANTVKRSFSSFLGQVNNVLNPSPDDSDTEAILIGEDSETVPLTKLQKAIYELQKNADTFVSDPDPSLKEKFDCWLQIVDEQFTQERLEKQLQYSAVLRKQYEALVPDPVSHTLFWKRYLFKKALMEDEIAHQEAIEKKIEKEKEHTEQAVEWDQENFAPHIDLTEEEQIKLLEAYDNEIKSKNNKSSDNLKKSGEYCDKELIEKISKQEINDAKEEMKKTGDIKEVNSAASLESTSSNSSSDGDWEKIDGFLTKTTIVSQNI